MTSKLGFRFAVLAACSGTILVGGCTAILGSFDVSTEGAGTTSSSGTTEAGGNSDSPNSQNEGGGSSSGSDAPSDAPIDASALLLQCAVQNIRTVEEITDANDSFDNFLYVFRLNGGGQVRIVARHKPSGGSLGVAFGFRAYAFDPKVTNSIPQIFDGPTDGRALDVRRQGQQNQIAVLSMQSSLVGVNAVMSVLQLPDANLSASIRLDVSKAFALPVEKATMTGALGVFPASNEYTYAYSVSNDQATTNVYMAHATPAQAAAPQTIIATAPNNNLAVSDLVRTSQGIFVFDGRGPDSSKPTLSTGYWKAPDTADQTNLASNPISKGPKGSALLSASSTAAGGLRLVSGELDFSGTGSPAQVRAGDLGPTTPIDPIEAANLPLIYSAASLLELPFGGRARSINDEVVWIGPPTSGGEGLNFLWYGLDQNALRATNVNAKKLLQGRNNITASAVGFSATPTNISGDLDLVWIESNANKKTLFYGTLTCLK